MKIDPNAIVAWVNFWKTEGIRFLGFCNAHIPDLEERCFHAYIEGYKAGKADAALDFDLPEGCHIAAIELEEVE